MAYIYGIEYPKLMRPHDIAKPEVVVNSRDEEEALGKDYYDIHEKLKADAKEPAKAKKGKD